LKAAALYAIFINKEVSLHISKTVLLRRINMFYPEDSLYIVGNSKSQMNNPITQVYGQFFIGFIVEKTTGNIVDVECNSIISLTNNILRDILVGENMAADYDTIKNQITGRYLGSSQKAILVAFKDAQKKYFDFKSGKPVEL
jgi:hypothetical protein